MERLSVPARRRALVLFCAAFLFIAWCVPYVCTDDLQWGMAQGVRWWREGLLNGRYAGNLLAVVMCHSPLAKTLIMGLCMFALPLAMAAVASPGARPVPLPLYCACCAGLLLMPPVMWQGTYGWVSAFGNYVVPTLLFFLWLLALDHIARRRARLWLWAAVLLPFTLVMGLFVENLSALFLGGSALLALYALKDRQLAPPFLACFAGSLLALLVMLTNDTVSQLAATGSALNGLRTLTFSPEDGPLGVFWGIFSWYAGRLLPIAFLRGFHMALPLGIFLALTFWRGPLRPLAAAGLLPLGCFLLFWSSGVYFTPGRIFLACLCWLLPLPALALERRPPGEKLRLALLYLSAPLSLLPLAITPTLGHRLYFFPTAVLVACAAAAARPLLSRPPAALLAVAGAAVLLLAWGWGELQAARCTWLRADLIQQAAEEQADTLILPTDAGEDIIWYARNPWDGEYARYYRQFYGISGDTTLIFLPAGSFERWPEVSPEDWARRRVFPPSDDQTSSLP